MDRHSEYENDVLAEMAKTGLEKGWIKEAGRWYKSPAVGRWQTAYNAILKRFPELQSEELPLIEVDDIYGPISRKASDNLNKLLFDDRITPYASRNPQVKASLDRIRNLMQHDFHEFDKKESSVVFTKFWPEAMGLIPDILQYIKDLVPLNKISPFASGKDEAQQMMPPGKQKGPGSGRAVPSGDLPPVKGPEEVGTGKMPKDPGPHQDPFEGPVPPKATPAPLVKAPKKGPAHKSFEPWAVDPSKRPIIGPPPVHIHPSDLEEYKADDAVFANVKNKIVREAKDTITQLVTLATELDQMGATAEAISIDRQLHAYRTDVEKLLKQSNEQLYDIFKETGESFLNSAHPTGEVTIAPSKSGGGVVETTVTEQKKIIDAVKKAPTGKLASTINELVVLANRLDNEGKEEAANIVDQTLRDVLREDPFVSRGQVAVPGSFEKSATELTKDEASGKLNNFASTILSYIGKLDWTGDTAAVKDAINTQAGVLKALASKVDGLSFSEIAKKLRRVHGALNFDYNTGKSALGPYDFNNFNTVVNRIDFFITSLNIAAEGEASAKKPKEKESALPLVENTKKQTLVNLRATLTIFANPKNKPALERIFGDELLETNQYLSDLYDKISSGKIKPSTSWQNKTYRLYTYLKNEISAGKKEKKDPAKTKSTSASLDKNMKKYAKGLSRLKEILEGGGTAPARRRGKGRRRPAKNQAVENFQSAMKLVGLGGSLGSTRRHPDGVDGVWGRKTAETWNAFITYVKENAGEKYSKKLPKASRKLTSNVSKWLDTATKWAKVLGEKGGAGKEIKFPVDGVEISSKQLANLSSLKGLSLQLNKKPEGPIFGKSKNTGPAFPGTTASLLNHPLSKRADTRPNPYKETGADEPKIDAQMKETLDKVYRSLQGEGGKQIRMDYSDADLARVRGMVIDLYTELGGGKVDRSRGKGAKYYREGNTIIIVYPDGSKERMSRQEYDRRRSQSGASPQGVGPLQELQRILSEVPDYQIMSNKDRFAGYINDITKQPENSNSNIWSYISSIRGQMKWQPTGEKSQIQKYWLALKFVELYQSILSYADKRRRQYIKQGIDADTFSAIQNATARKFQALSVLRRKLRSTGTYAPPTPKPKAPPTDVWGKPKQQQQKQVPKKQTPKKEEKAKI